MLSQEMKKRTSGEIFDSRARFCSDDSLDYLVTVILKDEYIEQSLKLQMHHETIGGVRKRAATRHF